MYSSNNKKTWILWLIYLLAICTLITITGNQRTVTSSYFQAAVNWFSGKNLYNNLGTDFIYLPQSAILYYPLTWVTFALSEIIWRLLSIGIYAAGTYRFSQIDDIEKKEFFFLIITIICLPIAFASARNGQMNLILAGLSLLALVDLKEQCLWRATGLLCLALALKPTAIVIFLLVFGLFPAMRLRLLLGALLVIILPFLTQNPHYVVNQYQSALHMLSASANLGTSENSWAQLFGLLAMFNIHASAATQYSLRIIAAACVLVACWYANKKLPSHMSLFYLYAFSSVYLMLFNPRSENNDYAILAPALGFAVAYYHCLDHKALVSTLIIMVLAIIGGYTLGHWLTPGHVSWITPLMASAFAVIIVWRLFSSPSQM